MTPAATSQQRGITLVGLIFVLGVLGLVGVLGLKVVPTAIEFMSIKKAIAAAKAGGSTPAEVRASFDRQATTGYIDSITGKDLDIVKDGDQIDINVAYQKKIPLIGPASLLIDYVATTASAAQKKTTAF